MADLNLNPELLNCVKAHVCVEKCNFEEGFCGQNRMFASKMADLNLSPEPLNRMKSRLCVENGRSELRFGGLKSRDEQF